MKGVGIYVKGEVINVGATTKSCDFSVSAHRPIDPNVTTLRKALFSNHLVAFLFDVNLTCLLLLPLFYLLSVFTLDPLASYLPHPIHPHTLLAKGMVECYIE